MARCHVALDRQQGLSERVSESGHFIFHLFIVFDGICG